MQAIINGEMYEVEPAVKVIIDKLMIENARLKKENARLEELYQKSVGVIAATDCVECKHKEYINDVNHAISCIRDFCTQISGENVDSCEKCAAHNKGYCMFMCDFPEEWENLTALINVGGAKMDGGAEDETD